MSWLVGLLRNRAARSSLQVAGSVLAAGCVGLSFSEATLARVAAISILALLALAGIKFALIALTGAENVARQMGSLTAQSDRLEGAVIDASARILDLERVVTDQAGALARLRIGVDDGRSEFLDAHNRTAGWVGDLQNRLEVVKGVLADHEARFLPDQDSASEIVRRFEPVGAQVAILKNEVLSLNEAIERTDRRLGSIVS